MLFQAITYNKNVMIKLNNEKLHSIVSQINLYLQEKEKYLKVLKENYNPMKSENYKSNIKEIILDIIKQEENIEGIGIINNKGIVTSYIGRSRLLQKSQRNKPVIDQEYVSDITSREITLDYIESIETYKKCITILSPYKHEDNEIIFFINISSQKIFSILDSYPMDNNEYLFVIDDDNNVLDRFRMNKEIIVYENNKIKKDIEEELKHNKNGYIKDIISINGEKNIISYKKINNSPWTVLYVKNTPKAYIPLIKKFTINLTILIFIGMIIYLIVKMYFLQMKREQDFWVYKMERMEMLIQISTGIAHEIRNPLSTIKGYIQINHAKNPDDLSYAAINDLQKIENTLNKSLNLSRLLNENKNSYHPHEIIEEIHYLIEAVALLRDVDIEYNIDESLPKIGFPKDYLRFIILDIVQHVIKAQGKNGIVEISIQKINKKHIQFSINSNKYKRARDKGMNKNFINMVRKMIELHKGNTDNITDEDGKNKIYINIPFDSNQ